MARVSDVSRTGPEGGRSAPSPLGREGAEDGLSKLMRSGGGSDGLSVPFVSSNSRSASPVSGVSKSYLPESTAGRPTGSGLKQREVTGRQAAFSASWTVRALWVTVGEQDAAFVAVALLLSTAGLLAVVRLRSLGAGAFVSESGAAGADCAGVSMSKPTESGCAGGFVTGGLGAVFLRFGVRGDDGEDAASGETGGLLLAFRAASLGECLRFGGIGVPAF